MRKIAEGFSSEIFEYQRDQVVKLLKSSDDINRLETAFQNLKIPQTGV